MPYRTAPPPLLGPHMAWTGTKTIDPTTRTQLPSLPVAVDNAPFYDVAEAFGKEVNPVGGSSRRRVKLDGTLMGSFEQVDIGRIVPGVLHEVVVIGASM